MMAMPKYITITPVRTSPLKPTVTFSVSVKRWGYPIIAYQAIKEHGKVVWYLWPKVWLWVYPKCCIRMIRGGANGN